MEVKCKNKTSFFNCLFILNTRIILSKHSTSVSKLYQDCSLIPMRPALSGAISLAILSDHIRKQVYSSSIDVQQQVHETHLNKANVPFRKYSTIARTGDVFCY